LEDIMRWTLLLERKTENALNHDIARRHLRCIADAAERNRGLGFVARVGKLADPQEVFEDGQARKRYLVKLRLEESKARSEDVARERFRHVRAVVEKCARSKGWAVLDADAAASDADDARPVLATPRTPFRPPPLTPEVLATHFADVYDRDAQLRLIDDAVQTHVLTGGDIRAHCILFGLPGGCKSTLLERLKPLYDDEHERMVFMDATSMTKAGLENWLIEQAEAKSLPEILVIEEIEKVDNKDNLMCLGSTMASGYLLKTNARIGRVQVPCKFLVLATCNDEEALKAFRRGFLWDRFTNQSYCPLPDRETLRRVLLDKVARIPGGRPSWADRALELADRLGVRTPRKVIGYLAGRHRLDSGDYQRDQIRVFAAEQREKASMKQAG
jgi:hypothetical protein